MLTEDLNLLGPSGMLQPIDFYFLTEMQSCIVWLAALSVWEFDKASEESHLM